MLKPNSTVTTNLIKAREMIADPKDWSQGLPMRLRADGGVQRCAANAVVQFNEEENSQELLLLEKAAIASFGMSLVNVNDVRGHAAVMSMFERAIELSLQEAEAS